MFFCYFLSSLNIIREIGRESEKTHDSNTEELPIKILNRSRYIFNKKILCSFFMLLKYSHKVSQIHKCYLKTRKKIIIKKDHKH